MDYVYCYLSYYGYKAGRATMDGFWAEMDRLGKDRNPYQAGFLQFVGVAESRQHAFDLYAEAAEYFYGRCLHVDPRWATPPGYTSEGSQRAGIESQMKKAADANVRGKSTGERSPPSPAKWMRSSTTATSSSAPPTRSPSNCAKSRPTSTSAT